MGRPAKRRRVETPAKSAAKVPPKESIAIEKNQISSPEDIKPTRNGRKQIPTSSRTLRSDGQGLQPRESAQLDPTSPANGLKGDGVRPASNTALNHLPADSGALNQKHPFLSKLSRTNIEFWAANSVWPETFKMSAIPYPRLRTKSSISNLTSVLDTPLPQDAKGIYKNPAVEQSLEKQGVFIRPEFPSRGELDTDEVNLCQQFLDTEQQAPSGTIFDDALFEITVFNTVDRNEAQILRRITPLLVPCAEDYSFLMRRSYAHLLYTTTSEAWLCSIPILPVRPQPDYSIGFFRRAFNDDQMSRLQPYIRLARFDITRTEGLFCSTAEQYFPFFTCEVKCKAGDLEEANRQNGHSMGVAVRSVVQLFRKVKREKEVDRKALAFSISHDHRTVLIHAWYPILGSGEEPDRIYRYTISEFAWTSLPNRWISHRFMKNLCDMWIPGHLNRLRSAIDELEIVPFVDLPSQSANPRPDIPIQGLGDQDDGTASSIGESSINRLQEEADRMMMPPPAKVQAQASKTSARPSRGKPNVRGK